MINTSVPWRVVPGIFACVAIAVFPGCSGREDADDVLRAMARAYREASAYADDARVRIEQMEGDELTERTLPFRVAFVRPDRLRVDAYDAHLATAGGTLRGAIGGAPGQVLVSSITPPLTLDRIFADRDLTAAVTEGEAGCPTQLPLLLADDTLDLVLADATGPARITGAEPVEGQACDRIVIPRSDGELVLWIDRRSRILRRMEVPAAAVRADGAAGMKIVVEYTDAAFTAPPVAAFGLEVPPGAVEVARLEPPRPPRPLSPLVGRPAPAFSMVTADGDALTPEMLAGTIAVLEFFFDGCEPCTRTMPLVGAAVNGFVAAHASAVPAVRVRHFAVSVDEADVGNDALGKRLAEYGGVGTLLRDVRGAAAGDLGVEDLPTVVIIAPDGRIADVQAGERTRIGTDVRATLEAIAAGKDTLPVVRQRRTAELQAYRDELRQVGARLGGQVERLPEQSIAARRQPLRFKLVRQWRAEAVALPGNLLCLDDREAGADGPRVIALDGWRTVVALDSRGRELARHELPLPPDAAVGFLRTARDAAGRRWWLGAARGGQQVFVFDDAWKLHATYPEAGGGLHAGIAAADFTAADGTPEIAVGYLGTIGVHCCNLAGVRQWRDRTPGTVVGMAAGAPGSDEVLAATADGRLARVPAGGAAAALSSITGFRLGTLAAGPVGMDGAWSVIAWGRDAAGGNAVIGLGPGAEPFWDIPLPAGLHRDGPIEPFAWADLLGSARRQWLIAGPDGSVTVAWADGGVVDRYQHGAALVGIGGYHHGGRGHIVLATRTGIEAFLVDDVALD